MLFNRFKDKNLIDGDIIELALNGTFDVIVQGVNCFNTQQKGLAKRMVEVFKTNNPNNHYYPMESPQMKGDIQKLGNIEWCDFSVVKYPDGNIKVINGSVENLQSYIDNHFYFPNPNLSVINAYTQYTYGDDGVHVDYSAIELCMKKIDKIFSGKRVGLPKIGTGLAGGNWKKIEEIIDNNLKNVDYKIVNYIQNV